MSALNAAIAVFSFVLFVLIAMGLHSLQMWLEGDSNNWRKMLIVVNAGRPQPEAEFSPTR